MILIEYLYSDKVACSKWLDRCSVTILFINVERMAAASTALHRQKGLASKIQVPRPEVIKMYQKVMGGVHLIHQRAAAHHLHWKLTIRFYLNIFFDLMNVASGSSCTIYKMMHPNDLTLLNFKTVVSTYLIGRYTS